MQNRRNYYRILKVQPDAPPEIIRASYRTLMRELKQHPDLGGEQWNAMILNEAYETLRDETKRAGYDRKLYESCITTPDKGRNSSRNDSVRFFCSTCKKPLYGEARRAERCPSCRSTLKPVYPTGNRGKSDYRSVFRMNKNGDLQYYTSRLHENRQGRMIDVSPQGIRFACYEKLRPDSTVHIRNEMLKGEVKITNTQQKEEDSGKLSYLVGARFLNITFMKKKGSFISTRV